MVDNLITLYDSNERNFTTNGLGALVDASECTVEEELNGAFELTMSYPIDGQHYTDLGIGKIIFAKPNRQSEKEPFRIYSISTPLSETVTVKAQHISYDLSGYILPKFNTDYSESGEAYATGPRTAFARIESELAKIPEYSDFPFTFYTDSDEDYAGQDVMYELTCPTPKSVRNMLGSGDGSMLSVYSGEYYFNRFAVNFLVQRGADNGVTLRYGKNLTSLTVDEDASTLYSGVYPFWRGAVTEKDANGQEVQNEKCIELPEKIITITEDAPKNVYLMDLSSDYTSWPGDENVREIVEKYISDNALGLPFSSLKVSYEQLSKSNEYNSFINFDSVELGDYVTVEYGALLSGPQKVRCTKISYDVLLDKIESIDLGSESTLTDSISQQQSTLSNSTNYTREYVQEQLSNISYDTALSTTSTNAVQNKVVTSKFSSVDKTCNGFKNEIASILEIIQNLPSDSGSKTTYGFTVPTGGNNGDAYVQLKSETIEPVPTVSVSTDKLAFDISNFTQASNGTYSFDMSGTKTASYDDRASLNVTGLTSGADYEVSFDLQHNVAADNGNPFNHFGMLVSSMADLYTAPPSGYGYPYFSETEAIDRFSRLFYPSIKLQNFSRNPNVNEHYAFTFTAANTTACLNIIMCKLNSGTTANLNFTNLKVKYLGTPLIPKNGQSSTEYQTVGSISAYGESYYGQVQPDTAVDNDWFPYPTMSDTHNCMTGWCTESANGYWQFTFNDPQKIEYLEMGLGMSYGVAWTLVNREYTIEGTTDGTNWAVCTTDYQTFSEASGNFTQLYHGFRINSGNYKAIRVRTGQTGGGITEFQVYRQDEMIPTVSIKDLYFKIDGEWMKYPSGSNIIASTQDIVDGTTPLEDGTLYTVYEN